MVSCRAPLESSLLRHRVLHAEDYFLTHRHCVPIPNFPVCPFSNVLLDASRSAGDPLGASALLSSPVRSAVRQYSILFVWMLASKSNSSCLPWAVLLDARRPAGDPLRALGLQVSHSPVTREVCRQTVFHVTHVDAGKQSSSLCLLWTVRCPCGPAMLLCKSG